MNDSKVEAREIEVERDGTRLFALDAGQGPPLVFLHGGLADHRAAWARFGALAGTHRVITPDLRGSGRSIYAGKLSWDKLADDVVAVLGQLGIERAIVGGMSMGSAVAVRFALRHPQCLRGLILMSPVYPGADRPLPTAASEAMMAMGDVGEQVLAHGVAALRPLFERLPEPVRERATRMALGFDPASVVTTTRFLASKEQPMSSAHELESIEVPVLVLPGVDPQHPPEIAERYVQHLRHPLVVQQTAPDMLDAIARFCSADVATLSAATAERRAR
jgi:pimeloyl-ACP methyl ester carboxylesterase